MPFPEFEPGKKKILFFSRGRGRGHAIPDIEIVKELHKLREDVDVRFVSYSTGARTLEAHGFSIIDVDLPATGEEAAMTALSGRLIRWLQPDLIVSHEEFAVLPVAKIFDRTAIFITDWFSEPDSYWMRTLRFADNILVMGESAIFDEPPWVEGKVEYLGWFVRAFDYGPGDRTRARRELGWAEGETVVTVLPGSWPEAIAPIMDLVVSAFDRLECSPKKLVWLAGEDYELIRRALADRNDVLVLEHDWRIDRLMVASDLAVTKSNRMTVLELRSLRTPHISLTHGINAIDDKIIASLDQAIVIQADETTPAGLCAVLARQGRSTNPPNPPTPGVASRLAARICDALVVAAC